MNSGDILRQWQSRIAPLFLRLQRPMISSEGLDRPWGLLLFLPVPFVLWCFTWRPFGTGISLILGLVSMLTHRIYARPFVRTRAGRRCLWCGRHAAEGPWLEIAEPGGVTAWRFCGDHHARHMKQTVDWAWRYRWLLRIGILGGLLALFMIGALSTIVPALSLDDGVCIFRLGVVAAVLPLGWGTLRHKPTATGPLKSPFPLHIQALIGSLNVIWLFRVIGLIWLGSSLFYLARRGGIV